MYAGVFQIRVKVEKNPELGFSISGGVGGRGNPFRPDDNVNSHSVSFLLMMARFSLLFLLFSALNTHN